MNKDIFTVKENISIAPGVCRMVMEGTESPADRPGQFVNIEIDGLYLRRPISVCDWSGNTLTVIYKVVGKGTEALSKMAHGVKLDVLTRLGNGYDMEKAGDAPLLIGGGVGTPPLYGLAKRLIAEGKKVSVILGFNTKSEVFLEEDYKALGASVTVTTADGSYGVKGFVTDAMPDGGYTHVFTCGPEPMLKAVYGKCVSGGQFSFEERMGCGFGACMGCTCETKYGHKRICKDGPVLEKEEIIW